MDDKHVLRSIDKITRNGRYDAADWARACSYLNARNKHEVIRWAGLIDLILSDASKEAVLAHAGRCMMGVKLADEHNNYALTGVLTGHHTESDVPFDHAFMMQLMAQTDRSTRLSNRVDKRSDNSWTRGGGQKSWGRGGGRSGRSRGGGKKQDDKKHNGNNNNNNNNNSNGGVRANSGSSSSGGARSS
jgi:hypothetical protein